MQHGKWTLLLLLGAMCYGLVFFSPDARADEEEICTVQDEDGIYHPCM